MIASVCSKKVDILQGNVVHITLDSMFPKLIMGPSLLFMFKIPIIIYYSFHENNKAKSVK